MPKKIPVLKDSEVVRAFERAGFQCVRISSSHHILKKAGCTLSIPVHAGKDYGKGLLKTQIDAAGLTIDQFIDLI